VTDDWPISAGREKYHPIPASWIGWGYDDGRESEVRLYAVSAAVVGLWMKIRYTQPQKPGVLVVETRAQERPDGDGHVPAELASRRTWMRSTTPQGQDPDDVRRGPETAHLRELWHDRVDVIPAPGESAERAVADGGREQAIQALTDLDQSHLGRQGGEQR
jgi:hypothetical protein